MGSVVESHDLIMHATPLELTLNSMVFKDLLHELGIHKLGAC
jgi:hypothetical protein